MFATRTAGSTPGGFFAGFGHAPNVDQAASEMAAGIVAVIARRRSARSATVTIRLSRRAVSVLAMIGYAGSDLSKTSTLFLG